ncbi:MAG TPA: PAS domain S-box protein, partial [Chthonomonadaceae bacterium]|nr:PAS domain S-box protein [Chthonomonadaceae bacterium]
MSYPIPEQENKRLSAPHRHAILDTPFEAGFDRLTALAAQIFHVPIALISFVDRDRQWFKSCHGFDVRQTGRDVAFCTHTLHSEKVMVVEDARQDPRFRNDPLVTGQPFIRFYAGAPLVTKDKICLGTLCIIDTQPRALTAKHQAILAELADVVIDEMEMRTTAARLQAQADHLQKAETELQEATHFTERLLASISSILIGIDGAGNINLWNARAEGIFRMPASAILGQRLETCNLAWDWEQIEQNIERCRRIGQSVRVDDVPYEDEHGDARLLGFSLHPVQGPDTAAQGFLLIGADITERKQTEEALRHYGHIFEQVRDGILQCDMSGNVVLWNGGAEQIFGYSQEEVLGKHLSFLYFDEDLSILQNEVLPPLMEQGRHECEIRVRHRSGREIYVNLSLSLLLDAHQSPYGLVGVCIATTERKRMAEALRESEERLRLALRAGSMATWSYDLRTDQKVFSEGYERLFGVAPGTEITTGREFLDRIYSQDRKYVDEYMDIVLQEQAEIDYEFRVVWQDDSIHWLSAKGRVIYDADGKPIGRTGLMTDITKRKQAEEALAKAVEALETNNWELAEARDAALAAARVKSEFLANTSHEIRTPLNGVIGMAEVLANTPLDLNQQNYLRTLKQSAEGLLGIINDILDFSKMEATKLSLEKLDFSLRDVIEDTAALLSPKAHEKGLQVCCLLPALGTPAALVANQVQGDPTRLKQIVTNLFANAIKFTDAGGVVTLGAELLSESPMEACWRLYVRDTGIGIPKERQSAIFESFTQADGSTTRRFGGTGLGLTICRQLVSLMGGEIHVESEVGRGSEFQVEITLPKQV